MSKRKQPQRPSLRDDPEPPVKYRFEPVGPSDPKPLWRVGVTAAPCGTFTLQVRAHNEPGALQQALEAAFRRPEVWHILDTDKPVRISD